MSTESICPRDFSVVVLNYNGLGYLKQTLPTIEALDPARYP